MEIPCCICVLSMMRVCFLDGQWKSSYISCLGWAMVFKHVILSSKNKANAIERVLNNYLCQTNNRNVV